MITIFGNWKWYIQAIVFFPLNLINCLSCVTLFLSILNVLHFQCKQEIYAIISAWVWLLIFIWEFNETDFRNFPTIEKVFHIAAAVVTAFRSTQTFFFSFNFAEKGYQWIEFTLNPLKLKPIRDNLMRNYSNQYEIKLIVEKIGLSRMKIESQTKPNLGYIACNMHGFFFSYTNSHDGFKENHSRQAHLFVHRLWRCRRTCAAIATAAITNGGKQIAFSYFWV